MIQQLEKRLETLKTEFEQGRRVLADLDAQRLQLEQKMLRISGAMQVLEEELQAAENNTAETVQSLQTPVLKPAPKAVQKATG